MTMIATTAQIAFNSCLVYIHAAKISPFTHCKIGGKGGGIKPEVVMKT